MPAGPSFFRVARPATFVRDRPATWFSILTLVQILGQRSGAKSVRLMRLLRSRTLAIWLLVGLTAYSWVATVLAPDQAPAFISAGPAADALARLIPVLGFDHPFSSPVFLLAIALVAASTTACAWERSRTALRRLLRRTPAGDNTDKLLLSPQFFIAASPSVDSESLSTAAVAALGRFRLKVRASDDVITGAGGSFGLLGSALFHWALVGVFVFAALGQLTRYEGYTNVTEGQSVRDSTNGYDVELVKGPLFGGWFSGLTLGVADIDPAHTAGDVARGGAPLVTLSDGDREIKRQWVFPNHPMRFGPLLVHRADVHPVFLGTLRNDGSNVVRRVKLDYAPDSPEPQGFTVNDVASNQVVQVDITSGGPQLAKIVVVTADASSTQTVAIGESIEVAQGQRLTVDALTYAAQLHVVSDWSVPWLYGMFVLGTLSVAAAVLVPTRTVSVLVVSGNRASQADGMVASKLHVRFTHRRNDPAFPRLLKEALQQAVDALDIEREAQA